MQRDFGGLGAVREVFDAEALQQVFGQRRHTAGVLGQFVCRHFQVVGRFLEGFVGQGLFVGLVQDVRQVGGHRIGQPACGQLVRPRFNLRFLLRFALNGGQCLLQDFGGRGFEHAFTFFVEIHGCGIKRHQRGGQLHGFGFAAEIFLRGFAECEFIRADAFPQQFGVDGGGFVLRFLHKRVHVAVKFQKYVGGFDFHALAVLRVGLIGAVVFLDDAGCFEVSAFFVKNIHNCDAVVLR